MHSWLQIRMLNHFLFNEFYGFCWYIASVIVEALKLPKQWKQSVSHSTTKLIVITNFSLLLVVIFEVRNFRHFSFKIGSILEEIAFVELVKLVPYFIPAVGHFRIILFWYYCVIFHELMNGDLLHLRGKLVKNDFLFGSALLIELHLSPLFIFLRLLLHCWVIIKEKKFDLTY